LCGRLAPALAVDLKTAELDSPEEICVLADDWKTMPGAALIRRLSRPVSLKINYGFPIEKAAESLRTIERDGQIIARAALDPPAYILDSDTSLRTAQGMIVSGGLEVGTLQTINGLFLGTPTKADREGGEVSANREELAAWATGQAQLWAFDINNHFRGWPDYADMLCGLGADMSGIHICCSREIHLDIEALEMWAAERTEIFVLDSEDLDVVETSEGLDIWSIQEHVMVDIGDNTLISFDTDGGGYSPFFDSAWDVEPTRLVQEDSDMSDRYTPYEWWNESRTMSLDKTMITAIATAWKLSVDTLLNECITLHTFRTGNNRTERAVAETEDMMDLFLTWSAKRPGV
jgi:hypothetical protein